MRPADSGFYLLCHFPLFVYICEASNATDRQGPALTAVIAGGINPFLKHVFDFLETYALKYVADLHVLGLWCSLARIVIAVDANKDTPNTRYTRR